MTMGPILSAPAKANDFQASFIRSVVKAYARVSGGNLIAEAGLDTADLGRSAYFGDSALLTHRGDRNATLNYGNVFAQRLWECDWDTLTQMPSWQTAPSEDQAERDHAMQSVMSAGFVRGYSGRRVSCQGRLFRIEQGVIWRLLDPAGVPFGVAAFFRKYSYL